MQIKILKKNDVSKRMVMLFLKYIFLKLFCCFFCQLLKRGDMPSPLGEEVLAPISNGLRRIMNLNCSFLLHPIRMGKSPTRIQR
jgi:hypothetical protein